MPHAMAPRDLSTEEKGREGHINDLYLPLKKLLNPLRPTTVVASSPLPFFCAGSRAASGIL